MKLTWNNPSVNVYEATMLEKLTTRDGDIVVIDMDTGLAYQGNMNEGTGNLQDEVEAFLATT